MQTTKQSAQQQPGFNQSQHSYEDDATFMRQQIMTKKEQIDAMQKHIRQLQEENSILQSDQLS